MFAQSRIQKTKAQRRAASKFFGRWNKDMKPKESKLDPVVKEKWLEALRSDHYKQTKNKLRYDSCDGSSFCCLGVLTDILDPDGWVETKPLTFSSGTVYPSKRVHKFKGSQYPNDVFPNQNAMKNVGLYPSAWKKLAEMNDEGMSFKEIANHIEKTY